MSNPFFIYLIIGLIIAHFLFAVAFLIYKIMKAPKSEGENTDKNKTS